MNRAIARTFIRSQGICAKAFRQCRAAQQLRCEIWRAGCGVIWTQPRVIKLRHDFAHPAARELEHRDCARTSDKLLKQTLAQAMRECLTLSQNDAQSM